MPLAHLVRALRAPALFTNDVLEPLLGSARAIQEFFHKTLPGQIQSDSVDTLGSLVSDAWTAARKNEAMEDFVERVERRQ
jgi:hypothetical protein